MDATQLSPPRLTRADYALLAGFCVLLFGLNIFFDRPLSAHETVHCQNVREMLASGDWIIPTYGGRPWLERPPLPHWLTALTAWPFDPMNNIWPFRLGSLLAGLACVLLTGWMGAVFYGRGMGLLAAFVLATTLEFFQYSTVTECDIYLCLVITTALALFVRLEFAMESAWPRYNTGFFGRRPWTLLAFCVVAGLTNMAKGLFFGMCFIALPVLGFVLMTASWTRIKRYVWLWGWLAFLVSATAWPLAAYLRYPDIVELWKSDYMGRLNQGYMQEPWYHYFRSLPLVLAPWSLLSFWGLGQTARAAWRSASPERFLWCWAWLPLLFFSIPQGKHHHYLLHIVPAWAILGTVGCRSAWQWASQLPQWRRHPATAALLLGAPAAVIVVLLSRRIPAPPLAVVGLAASVGIILTLAWWALTRPRPAAALAAGAVVFLAGYVGFYGFHTRYFNGVHPDREFITRVRELTHAEPTVLVSAEMHPLNGSWLLLYLGERTHLLHNLSFLRDADVAPEEFFLVGRAYLQSDLAKYGAADVIDQSEYTRGESGPQDRYTLFRVRLRPDLPRHSAASVYISPMQATGRAPGPYVH